MQVKDIVSLAQYANKSNPLRTGLTVAIIAIGITALIGIITCIEVLKGSIYANFSNLGSNTFTVTNQKQFVKNNHAKRRQLKKDSNEKITLLEATTFKEQYAYPSIVSMSIMASSGSTVRKNKKKSNPNINIMGVDENYIPISGNTLACGRNFNAIDIHAGENTCILGNGLAVKYFGNEYNAENNTLYVGDEVYRVVGVLKSVGSSLINRTDNMIYITIMNAKQKFNIQKNSYVLSIKINDIKQINAASEEAIGLMRGIKHLKPEHENNFTISTSDELANTLITNLKEVTFAAFFIGIITLFGAAIALMNIMLVAVSERTREIGITKAIGATNKNMQQQLLLEAIIISIKGGLIGIIIGILIGNTISFVLHTPFIIPWNWVLFGITICIFVGLLSGIYPALKAAKLNPIEALRYE